LPYDGGTGSPLETQLSNPNFHGWFIQLPPLIKVERYADVPWRMDPAIEPGRSVWICPSNTRRANVSPTGSSHNLFHYCLNENVNQSGAGAGANDPVQISTIERPTSMVWLFDTHQKPGVGTWTSVHTNLHSRGAQFTFLDGHAKRFNAATYVDPATGKGGTNNPDLVWTH